MRVELTDGAWADIRELSDLRDGDRKAVNRAVSLSVDPVTQLPVIPGGMDDDIRDALIKRVVVGWSFEHLPLPKDDAESLDRLSIQDARALHKAVDPYLKLVMGTEDPAKPGSGPTAG